MQWVVPEQIVHFVAEFCEESYLKRGGSAAVERCGVETRLAQ